MSGAERKKEWITFAEGLNPEMAEEGGWEEVGVIIKSKITNPCGIGSVQYLDRGSR